MSLNLIFLFVILKSVPVIVKGASTCDDVSFVGPLWPTYPPPPFPVPPSLFPPYKDGYRDDIVQLDCSTNKPNIRVNLFTKTAESKPWSKVTNGVTQKGQIFSIPITGNGWTQAGYYGCAIDDRDCFPRKYHPLGKLQTTRVRRVEPTYIEILPRWKPVADLAMNVAEKKSFRCWTRAARFDKDSTVTWFKIGKAKNRIPISSIRGVTTTSTRKYGDPDFIFTHLTFESFNFGQEGRYECIRKMNTKDESSSALSVRIKYKPLPGIDTCGVVAATSTAEKRIVGGTAARPGAWPWQARVIFTWNMGHAKRQTECGGALLSLEWIVLAAHCDYPATSIGGIQVILGDHDRTISESSEQTFTASKIIRHKKSNYPMTLRSDIALIKLNRPAVLNDRVNTVCLPSDVPDVGYTCTFTGWGDQSGSSNRNVNLAKTLQQAEMKIIDKQVCQRLHEKSKLNKVSGRVICAGHVRSTCSGDEGGPLVCKRAGRWSLQGVASMASSSCDSQKAYSLFSSVFGYKAWILKTIDEHS